MILKFTIDGKSGFFKKPDVNTNIYFTYSHIHKMAIMGIIGATIGLKGYNQSKNGEMPEFYEKLKDISVSICPNKKTFSKKVVTTTNQTGYASNENGGTLIIKEQWLENVSWDIYIKIDNDELITFKEYLLHSKSEFMPYLGKNEHIAKLSNIELFDNSDIKEISGDFKVDSLIPDKFKSTQCGTFKFSEYLPVSLNKSTSLYELVKLNFSDEVINTECVSIGNKKIFFI